METLKIKDNLYSDLIIEYTLVQCPKELAETCNNCAKGSYQKSLVNGFENWSGSTLKGKAQTYSGKYAESRYNLLNRIRDTVPDPLDIVKVFDSQRSRWVVQLVCWLTDDTVCIVGKW